MVNKIIQLPFGAGRIAVARAPGALGLSYEREGCATRHPMSRMLFETNLHARIFRHGRRHEDRNLGSGLVTNVGVLAMANDPFWTLTATPSALSTLQLSNWHASGTGVVAAAATDIKLGTISANGGQTPVAGTQTLVSAANAQAYRSVATISYTGTEAVTEWGLLTDNFITAATGSPFTAGSATSGTSTGTALTASAAQVRGNQQHIVERTSGTNLSYGLVTGNTTSVFTVPAWYLVATGLAGQNPANTETYVIRPVMWDRKQFAAINVANGDSIQFTYTLTINSGG